MPVAFDFAPTGWMLCEGQKLSIAEHTALYALIKTAFTFDSSTSHFNLPDLRGRTPIHPYPNPDTNPEKPHFTEIFWGSTGGSVRTLLSKYHIPDHTHKLNAVVNNESDVIISNPMNNMLGTNQFYTRELNNNPESHDPMYDNTVSGPRLFNDKPINSHSELVHTNPSLGIYHCIAITGEFPTR